jgi:hypothetical protein
LPRLSTRSVHVPRYPLLLAGATCALACVVLALRAAPSEAAYPLAQNGKEVVAAAALPVGVEKQWALAGVVSGCLGPRRDGLGFLIRGRT